MSRIPLILGGSAWAMVCFYGGLWLTFPGEDAAERIAWEVQDNSGGAWQLQVADVKPWRVTGGTLKEVQLLSVPRGRRGKTEAPNLVLRADAISVREEILPLLSGGYVAGIAADMYKGDLSGRVGQVDEAIIVDLIGEDLDISTYPFGSEGWTLDAEGLLQAKIDLTIDQEDIKASEGVIVLAIDDLALAGVSFSGITFDQRAEFSEAKLRLKVEDGKAKVKKGNFESDLVQIEVGGDISLADPISRSRLNLTVSFKLADDLDQMAKLMLKGARDDSGFYHFKATGSIASPNFREDRVAARGRGSSRSSSDKGSSKERPSSVRPSDRRPSRVEQDEKEEEGGFRDRRSDDLDRRKLDDDRRLPERRRPEIERRPPPDDRELDENEIGPDGPRFDDDRIDDRGDDEEFYDEDEEFIDEGNPDGLDELPFDR